MKKKLNKILFAGGGTSGHLYPIIAIAREIRRLYHSKIYYIGPKDDYNILSKEYFKNYFILTGKLRRYFSVKNFTNILFNFPIGYVQSLLFLILIRPQLVFSKGGSGSFQVCLAAKHLGIPVLVHESDSVPGLSNIKVSKWAKKVFVSFPKTEYFSVKRPILVGNPIRTELLAGSNKVAKEIFQIKSERLVLLFLGGSQGAQAINEFILIALNNLLEKYEIIHVSGPKNYEMAQMEGQIIAVKKLAPYYHLYGSLDEKQLAQAFAVTDLVISRAGSGAIFEIAATGKPSILVPLPSSAGDHQLKNAYQYANTGASLVIEQGNLTPNFFIGQVNNLFSQPEKLKLMRDKALKFAKPEAAQTIAQIIQFLYQK